jgi:trimethylamine:corrinoid methyltransferase-like protein
MINIKPIRPKPHLDVLDAEQLESIQSATLHVLEHVGIRFPSERALSVFAEYGAHVDFATQTAKLPPDLVQEVMRQAPRTYPLSGHAEAAQRRLQTILNAATRELMTC